MAFEFDIHAKRQISNEQILKALRKFVRLHKGQKPSTRCFRMWKDRPCGVITIHNRFGSWRKALIQAGVRHSHLVEADPEDLINNLERIWRKLGYPPGGHLLVRHGRYRPGLYISRWGSLRRACRLLADVHKGKLTRDEMIKISRNAPKRQKRRKVKLGLRWQILERDRFSCTICGIAPSKRAGAGLHIDHILPVSRGGTNDPANLRTLCSDCNLGRGAGRKKLPPARPAPDAGSDT